VKEKVIRFLHEMTNEETGEVAAITRLVTVYFDTAARKSVALPPDVRERAVGMIRSPA
jgi:acyl-CoA thioester hydrolase